jgi:hypothetical protein
MKKEITKKIFFDFLRRNNCLQEYLTACKKNNIAYNSNNNANISLKSLLQLMGVIDRNNNFNEKSIYSAFSWVLYPIKKDNGNSWVSLNLKWRQFLIDNNFI